MANEKRIAESKVTYQTLTADLSEPIIIERDGLPIAVVVPYQAYTELKSAAKAMTEQRLEAWRRLQSLAVTVQAQPTDLTPEEIEREITLASQEAKEIRRARRSGS
jgi:hypothetical protein